MKQRSWLGSMTPVWLTGVALTMFFVLALLKGPSSQSSSIQDKADDLACKTWGDPDGELRFQLYIEGPNWIDTEDTVILKVMDQGRVARSKELSRWYYGRLQGTKRECVRAVLEPDGSYRDPVLGIDLRRQNLTQDVWGNLAPPKTWDNVITIQVVDGAWQVTVNDETPGISAAVVPGW